MSRIEKSRRGRRAHRSTVPSLLERAGAEVVSIAVLGAEETETPLWLEEESHVHSIRPWHEFGTPEREQEE